MNHRNILIGIMMLAIVSTATLAANIYFPLAIDGDLIGNRVDGLEIQIKNLRTGITSSVYSTSAGEFGLDWANSAEPSDGSYKYMPGDQFEIRVVECAVAYSECVKTITYSGGPEIFVTIDMTGIDLPCPVCESRSCHCDDCEECSPCEMPPKEVYCAGYNDAPECAECPADTTPYSSCSSCCPAAQECPEPEQCVQDPCPVCEECEECGDWMKMGASLVIGMMLALVGFVGGGFKLYKNLKGESVFLHRHTGITAYHDPDTQHQNPKYRHRAWSKDPKGCWEDVKKINEQGGL